MMLHVDVDELMGTIKTENQEFKAEARNLAVAVNSFYSSNLQREREEIYANTDWHSLGEATKADNLAAALRIPEVLSFVGLKLEKVQDGGAVTSAKVRAVIRDQANLKEMAKAEHNGWMNFKVLNGWKFDELPEMNSWLKKLAEIEGKMKRASTARQKSNLKKRMAAAKREVRVFKKAAEERKLHHAIVEYEDLPPYMKKKDRDAVKSYPEIVALAGYRIVFEELSD